MTQIEELVKRIRADTDPGGCDLHNAADVIEELAADLATLRAKLERAKEALKPFAPIVDLPYDDERICVIKFYEKNGEHIVPGFKWGFFRRARAVLAELSAYLDCVKKDDTNG